MATAQHKYYFLLSRPNTKNLPYLKQRNSKGTQFRTQNSACASKIKISHINSVEIGLQIHTGRR